MKYIGGKALIARHIANIITQCDKRLPRFTFIEPFTGGFNIVPSIYTLFDDIQCSDIDANLILLYQALRNGWEPPNVVTRDMYNAAKGAIASPLKSFIGYTCSYNGKWFGGYAEDKVTLRNYAQEAVNWCAKVAPALAAAQFACLDYRTLHPENALIYCDPPYADVTGYRNMAFDVPAFWSIVRQWTQHNTVLVSCYTAPEDFTVVWSKVKISSLDHTHNTAGQRTTRSEQVVIYTPQFKQLQQLGG